MFMAASGTEDVDRGRKFSPAGDTILVFATADLFSECLTEALAKKFPNYEVAARSSLKALAEHDGIDLKLVLFYRIAGAELREALQFLNDNHPLTSIGLVVDTIDMLEPQLSELVEERIIDGVMPLNLRLDVFMAAVELLMKGGEHFPSALLSRLNNTPQQGAPLYATNAVAAVQTAEIKLKQHEMSGLTTREVQILDLICKGTQNKIIADKLHLSENTVKVHVRNIYKKMNVRNRTEAASRFFTNDPSLGSDFFRKRQN
jgi:DNA-binding NarL/FixJ family response regulator